MGNFPYWLLVGPDVIPKCEKVLCLNASEKGQPKTALRWGDHLCLGNAEFNPLRDVQSFVEQGHAEEIVIPWQ